MHYCIPERVAEAIQKLEDSLHSNPEWLTVLGFLNKLPACSEEATYWKLMALSVEEEIKFVRRQGEQLQSNIQSIVSTVSTNLHLIDEKLFAEALPLRRASDPEVQDLLQKTLRTLKICNEPLKELHHDNYRVLHAAQGSTAAA